MKKRDFIQTACIQFMPETQWNIDKSIQYAEKLWRRLDDKGYGEPRQVGPHEIKKAYDKLAPVMKSAFDLFWLAFDHKQGKDEAAAAWLLLGERPKAEYDKIISAAKRTASARKNLPEGQVPIMAQGWLSKRRWLDSEETPAAAKARQDARQDQEAQKLRQDLAAAKRMLELTREPTWQDHVDRLTEQLRQLRDTHGQTTEPPS